MPAHTSTDEDSPLTRFVAGLDMFYLGGMLSMDYHKALVFLHDHEKREHGGPVQAEMGPSATPRPAPTIVRPGE